DLSNRLSKPYVFENAVKAKLVTFTDDSKMFIRPGNAVRYLIKRLLALSIVYWLQTLLPYLLLQMKYYYKYF
ncbi:hypothetical protein, partial [Bacillus spizizenii]|uniref:hypothetical protein n=1 Tax=Bacillus spizizenii TaxID=96241 RepID=UPI0010FDE5B8